MQWLHELILDEEEDMEIEFCCQNDELVLIGATTAVILENDLRKYTVNDRIANIIRFREHIDDKINRIKLNPRDFRRMYRLHPIDYDELLNKIIGRITCNSEMARRSSGSAITPNMKLAISLRILAGGSYLDIAFGYDVDKCNVLPITYKVLTAIDEVTNNIKYPRTASEFRATEATFMKISDALPGTVSAGDGVLFRMLAPNAKDVDGNVTSWFTRKGYYAFGNIV